MTTSFTIADEASATHIAFSTALQRSNDRAAVMMDRQGYAVAQYRSGIPAFDGLFPRVVCRVLANQTSA